MTDQTADEIKRNFDKLTDSEKEEVLETLSKDRRMPFPAKTNMLWIIVVTTFCFCIALAAIRVSGILVILSGSLNSIIVMPKDSVIHAALLRDLLPDVDKVMILFSSLVGFLAGIFVPSPVKNQENR